MATRKEIAQNQKILYDDAVANNMFQAAVPTFKEFQRRLEGQGYQKMVYDNYKKHNVKGKGFNNLNEFRGAFGGSFYADENKISLSSKAQAVSDSARQTVNNAGRYSRLKQRKQKQQNDFGRVNLGTHQTPYGGDANNVVKDEFAYNPETGKAGAYVTSDNKNAYTQSDAEQKQAILDQQDAAYQQAVDTGEIPSVFDVRDKKGNYDLQENINKNGTYLTEEGAQKQFDKKLADAYARKKEIEALIAEDNRQHGNPLLSYSASIGAGNGRTAEQSDYRNKLATSLSLVTEQIGALEAVKQYPTSSWGEDVLKALDNTVFTAKTWDFGLTDFATMGQIERIKIKMDNNIPLSGSDKMLLKSKLGADAAAALEDEKMGNIYRWTKIAGQSLPFMTDFLLTGGYGGITKGISRGALKYAAKRGMGKVSAAILKNTGIVAGDVIGSYAMAGTEQALKTGADIMQRHLGNLYQDEKGDYKFGTFDENGNLLHEGGESMGTALYKALTSAMVENYTEKLFGHNYGIKKGAIAAMENHGMDGTAQFFKNIGKSGWYTNSKKWMEKFGINGFGEEVMEEEIGIPLHALLDGDNNFSDLGDAKQQLDIIGGMAISVGSMYAMGTGSRPVKGIYNRAQYYRFRNKVNVADIDAQNLMGDNWADIKDKIDNATNEQMGGVLADILRQRDTMTKEQINAAVNYGVNLMKMRGYNIAKTAEMNAKEITNEPTTPEEQHQADIDNAYSEGHDADDADKHDIQIQQEDQMKTLAAALGISEQQLSAMSDDELESLTGQDDKLDQAIYDYQLSSARYQGVVDDAQDKVDLAAHQAEQRVDMFTDQNRGSVRNATIKASGGLEDYGVYIISGNIATHDDGSIDVSNSDDMILYYDPTKNSVEHADALMFAELGEELPADDVKAQAVADAKENAIKEIAGIIDGTVEVGSQFNVTDTDGTEHTYEVLADYGDGTAAISIDGNVVENPYSIADLQQMKDLEDQKRLEAAKAQREQLEKERADQQTQETEETQPSFDFNQILNDNGNVVLVDVLDEDGNTKYPDSKLFLIRDTGAEAKVVELKSDGTIVPHAVNKEDVATISSMSLDEYKQAFAASSMIEDNSGENRGEIEVESPTIEGETAAPAEETAAPEATETPATEQTPAAPAITLEDGTIVPMLEDGNPDFSKLTAAQTAELYDNQFGEDADSIVSGYVSDAKKALDKANNMTVKGKTFLEQKASKDAKEKAIADAQAAYDSAIAIRDAYNERQLAKVEDTAEGRKNLIEKARRKFARLKSAVKDDAEAVAQIYKETVGTLLHRLYDGTGIDVTDTIPLTAEEYVASNLGAHSLNYEGTETSKGVKQETGLSREDFAKTQLLAADGKGTTIDNLVHSLWENRPSNLDTLGTQDIRNALIDVLTSGFKASEARSYVENIRIAQAEKLIEEERTAAENAAFADEQKANREEEEKKSEENEKINEQTNENINTPELSHEQQKAKEDGEKLGFPAIDKEGEPINEYVIELAKWAKEQGLEIDPTSKSNSYADLFLMCKDGFGVSALVPDEGENINQVVYFPDNVQDFNQLWKLQEEFNAGRDLKHSSNIDSEITEGATFYDADTAREFKEFVDKKVEEQNKVFGEQRPEEDLPFSAKENGKQQTTSERAADVEKNKVDDMKVVDNIVGEKTRKAFERLAKMMGANIQWQYSDKLGNGWIQETKDADGNVHRTIFITLDSSITEGAQFIFGHEMTHQIKNLNPAAYNELTQLVLDTYGSDAFDKAVDETMQRYSDAGFSGRNREYYAEEVVADAVGEMIRDLNLAHTIAMKMSHPLLAAIHEILQKIKLAFFGTEYSDVTKNIIRSIEQAYVKTAKGEVTNSETGEDVSFSLRQKPEPKKKGVGYKVFVLKDGKLYPPMVANPDGAATPVGVWLDADAAPIAGESKTGRPQVKQGGKGTQGGSGKLAYRPGWHLGVVPYAIQFNRKDAEGNKTLFPKNFVFAEVEYAADVDYQEEARQEGINPSGKYQHSLAGLKHLPTDGYYMYRTNPNPETDPWVITGAMKVNRILTRAEQADLVSKAGREPQQIQEGDIVTDDVVNSINQEIAAAPKFSLKVYHGSGADFTEFDFDHMGEGAGSQAFGWGGYVTSSEKIGKSYANLVDANAPYQDVEYVGNNAHEYTDVVAGLFNGGQRDYDDVKEFLQNGYNADKENARKRQMLEWFESTKPSDWKSINDGKRNLYEVDIPEDNGSNYLDWYEPLTDEQKDKIAKQLKRLKVDVADFERRGFSLDSSFADIYNFLTYALRNTKKWQDVNAMRATSKFLSSLGFIGIKYPAGTIMGGAEEGDTNYVVFKPEDMKITQHTKFSLRLKSAIEDTETNPSDAQKEIGNYKKGHVKFGGYDYTIENPKGSVRSGKDADGKEWKVTMHDTYGYIRGKFGKDGDHLDMFINDKADLDNWNGDVFVVDQVNPDGSFDEHKVMYGYDSMDDAEKAYLANYSKGWQGLGNITGASKTEFDKWLDTSNRKLKPFKDYVKVKFSLKDNQGNPLNQDGTLKLDKIKSVDELTDEDFTSAFRNVEFPAIPKNVDAAIGANGKPVIIKKNIFEKNWNAHKFTPAESKKVLNDALYNTDLVGHTQPTKKPNHWVAIKLDDKSPITVLEVSDNKDNVEVVGWYTLDERNLGRIKRQAERNGGELIMLTPKDDKVESLSTPPLSSAAKIDNSSETAKENGEKFSLKGEKTLAGVHNITEEKLRKALKLGGFANPSLAVIDTSKSGHDNFGEISFIAPSVLLDKRTGKTAGTWITDAYTQRYPSVERQMSEKGYRKFEDWVDSLDYPSGAKAEIKRQTKDVLEDNGVPAWELMYLKEKGIDIKAYDSNVDYRWKEIINKYPTAEDILNNMKNDAELNEEVTSLAKYEIVKPTRDKISLEVRRQIYKETGVKTSPISPKVRKKVNEIFDRDYKSTLLDKDGKPKAEDVKKVVDDIVQEHNDTKKYDFYLSKVQASNYVNKNGLYDDYIRWQEKKLDEFGTKNRIFRGYKPDGTRKYVPETLENVSKAMREEADGQTNGSEYTSFGSFIAKIASRVDSTDEMRANKDKLSSNKDKEEFYEKWSEVYYDLAKSLYNDVFYGELRLHDIVLQSDPKKYAKKEYDITLTPTFMKKLDALKNAVQTELKSAYFETKYNRPLRLNEFAAAVVPDNLGEDVRKGIENAGLPMYNYDPNKEGDRSRAFNEAINSSDNIRFSLRNLDQEYLDAVKKGDMEKAQRLVNKAAAVAGYSTDSSYQGTSAFNGSAPWGNGYFLTKEDRKEAWDNGEFEGESTLGDYINDDIDGGNLEELTNAASYRAADPMRKEAIDNVRNAILKKSKFIKMYRSVPSDVKEGSFRNGDWITPSRSYAVDNAKLHGWGDDYNIIEQKVPVDDVWFDGNDIAEWGYGIEKDFINDTDFAYKNVKNNRKLLDVVTYNDDGEVIPLSQRFDPSNSDTRFSLRYDQFVHDLNQWKKDNNLPKDAQRPTIPQRNAGESAVDFLRRVDEYRKQMALWKTAPTYEQHLLSDDTALGEFNRELQKGSVLKRIAFQDSMLAIRKAQEAIMKEVGVDRLNMAEDAYTAENRSHGKGKNEFEEYNNEFLQPLRKAYHQMKKVLGDSYDNVRIYMMAKHGLERDAQMAFKKSLEADYEDVAQRSAAYKAYKGDMNRMGNDSGFELGYIDFNTWRQKDDALRAKYSPSYMNYRYDKDGTAFDYSGLSALFGGSDFEEAASKLVRDIESSHVVEVQDLWNATNAATKKILRDGYKAGMMSKDTYQYVRDMYSHYIPLRGWDGTTADQVWDYIGGGKGAFNQTLKTAHGRTSIADDPIAYIENMAESGILLNNKNWVKQHLMLLAQNHPTSLLTLSKAWYVKSTDANGNEEWIPATPQITSQMNSNQVKAAIDAFEQKMEQMAQTGDATQKRDGLNIAYPQTHSEEREHEVRVMKDGEEYVIYVNGDPQLAQAMNNTRAHRVSEGIKNSISKRVIAVVGRKMAAAYTSLSPLFIPSNYFRDLTMTLASTAIREDGRYNYLLRKNLTTSWNLGFMLKDYQNGKLREKVNNGNATPKEQMFYDFMMNGGETGFVSSLDVEDLKKKFKNDLKDLDRWKANPVKVGHTIMDCIEFLNRMIEDSNRFAIYMTSIQYGRSVDEAVNNAKDVTLNFNRKGTGEHSWQTIRNLYLFINPAVQSLQTLGALAKHHPFKFTAVTASWIASGVLVPIVNVALMQMAAAFLGGDGDDDKDLYKDISKKYWQFTKWDRRNNLIMWFPFTHEFIKIPLAQEFRTFYGLGDMIASKMMGGELAEESWEDYGWDLVGQVVDMLPLDPTGYDGELGVSLMPNPIRPVFELAFNVDFTGKPIFKDTEYNKYDPNFTKAYVGTPDWLVRASRMMNSIGNDYPDVQQNKWDALGNPRYNLNNPAVVDHVLSSYLGGAYTMGSQVLGLLTKSLNDRKEIKVADIPLVSKFVSNPDDRPVSKKQGDEFWDKKEYYDRASNTISKLKKQAKIDGDYSLLERFYGSEEYKTYKLYEKDVKDYKEARKKERAEESGDEYRPHQLNAEDIYNNHATPMDEFEDMKLKQLFEKLNSFKTRYDAIVDNAPNESEGYYNTNKAAIDAIDEITLDKQEISELKKGFLDDGKDAYNAEDMNQIRELRKNILSVLEKANKVVVANQKAKAEKK